MLKCAQDKDKPLCETNEEYHDVVLGFKIALIHLFLYKTSHYKNKWYAACLMLLKDDALADVMHIHFADFLILATDLTHLRLLHKANTLYDNKHVRAVLSILIDELNLSHGQQPIAHYWHDPMQDYYRLIGEAARIKRAGLYLCTDKNNLIGQDVMEISKMIHQGATAFGASICRHTLDYQPMIAARDHVKAKLQLASFKAVPKIVQVILDALDTINEVLPDKISRLSSHSHLVKSNMQKNINKVDRA